MQCRRTLVILLHHHHKRFSKSDMQDVRPYCRQIAASPRRHPFPRHAMTDLETRARALVAKWEHGSEEHRQWLRDIAVPDVVAFVEAEVAKERSRESTERNFSMGCAQWSR